MSLADEEEEPGKAGGVAEGVQDIGVEEISELAPNLCADHEGMMRKVDEAGMIERRGKRGRGGRLCGDGLCGVEELVDVELRTGGAEKTREEGRGLVGVVDGGDVDGACGGVGIVGVGIGGAENGSRKGDVSRGELEARGDGGKVVEGRVRHCAFAAGGKVEDGWGGGEVVERG